LPLIPAELGGYLISIMTLVFAAGPQITAHPALGRGLRGLSALCLVLVAARAWRAPRANALAISARHVFVTTLFNPKALVFAFAIFPPLDTMPPSHGVLWVGGFSALVVSVATGWIVAGAALGALLPRAVEEGWVRRAGALILCAFALVLATSVVVPHLLS
jgi:threonine/homoserine/homoserine lactone efflux protein